MFFIGADCQAPTAKFVRVCFVKGECLCNVGGDEGGGRGVLTFMA